MKILYFNGFPPRDPERAKRGRRHRRSARHPANRSAQSDHRVSSERFSDYRGKLEEAASKGKGVPLADVRMRPPLPKPHNNHCMAVNYMKTAPRPARARINAFHKAPTAVIGTSGSTIVSPLPMMPVGDLWNALIGAGSERVPSSM